jgi:cytochrome c-type biogenesis protein
MDLGFGVSVFVAFAAGLISFLSPCVLPLIPSYLSVVSGVSLEEMQEQGGSSIRRRVFVSSLLFVLGFSAVFIALGASFSLLGQALFRFREVLTYVGAVVIILFGLYVAGVFKPRLLSREYRLMGDKKPIGYAGALLVGVSFGIAWTPCVGPALGAILTLASSQGGFGQGTGLLVVYSAGLAIPFLLSSLALNTFLKFSKGFRGWMPTFQRAGGVVLVLMGVLLLTGQFTRLNNIATALTPEWILRWL